MALELFMLGLIPSAMGESLEFYRRLGLVLPEGSEEQPHVEVKMQSGLTFFLNTCAGYFGDPFQIMNVTNGSAISFSSSYTQKAGGEKVPHTAVFPRFWNGSPK
jgi:hypothetical protein